MRQKKDAKERANASLHVGHKKVKRLQRPEAPASGR
jgi:hypothetical protein